MMGLCDTVFENPPSENSNIRIPATLHHERFKPYKDKDV
jgi:hypothetical protein